MELEEATAIVCQTLRNMAASENFSAPKRVFTAIDVFLASHPDPNMNGQSEIEGALQ